MNRLPGEATRNLYSEQLKGGVCVEGSRVLWVCLLAFTGGSAGQC